MNFFTELKRRHIYRVAAAYAVVAWVLLQLFNNLSPILKLPDWAGTLILVLLIGGFPITLLIAWMRELPPVDGTTARAAAGKLDWVLIGGLIVVIALVSYQQLAPSPGARTAPLQTGGISIAVLPFANVSGDTNQEFFSDGITDEIMTAHAKLPALRVVGRESAFQFKGQKPDMRTFGQSLSAAYLIEGSVRKAGDRVRITAQLVQADNGVSLWTESYDRQLTDIFATQEDIAHAIAAALRVPLGLKQGETLVSDRATNEATYEDYLRAKTLVRGRGTDIARAVDILEPVVARDPGFAPAWAMLALAYELTPIYTPSIYTAALRSGNVEGVRGAIQAAYDKAEKAAREAIRLDSRYPVSYEVLARVQFQRGKWAAAEDLFRQALALDPNDPEVLQGFSLMLAYVGRLKDSLSMREKLRTLEPFVRTFNIQTAEVLQTVGQNAASIPILEALPADAPGREFPLAEAYAAAGRYAEAADMLLRRTVEPERRQLMEAAARLLRSAPAKAAEPLPDLDDANFVYAYVGAPQHMMDYPEHRLEFGLPTTTSVFYSLWSPSSAPVRKTDRFKAYVRDAGMVAYWRARGWPDLCRPMGADDFVCD